MLQAEGGLQSTKNYTYNYVNSTTKLITPREKYCSNLIAHTFYWVPSQSSFSNSLYCPFCFPDRIHICPVPISINCNYFICKIKKVEKKLPVKPAYTVHVATMWTYFATESTQQQQSRSVQTHGCGAGTVYHVSCFMATQFRSLRMHPTLNLYIIQYLHICQNTVNVDIFAQLNFRASSPMRHFRVDTFSRI